MQEFITKHWFKGVTAAAILAIAAILIINSGVGSSKLPIIKQATDFTLESSDGDQISFKESEGKVRLVYFFWSSCPDVCQPTTYELSKVNEELEKEGLMGDDVMMYSISFDPERDTVKQLHNYSTKFRKDGANWKFLRGDEKAIQVLAKEYAVSVVKMLDGTFIHTNSIALVDREGNIRKYIKSMDVADIIDYKEVVKDVVQLSKL